MLLSYKANAQNTDSLKLKVFVDCRQGCDINFLKAEITAVDFVTDRLAADQHILINSQPVGSGGVKYQLNFYGQNSFKSFIDTLIFDTNPNATAFETRERLLNYLMIGMSPLIAKTIYAKAIKVTMKVDSNQEVAAAQKKEEDKKDKWNFWVFAISANGNISAEQIYKNNTFSSNFSVNRITDKLRVEFFATGSLRNSTYSYDSTTIKIKNTDYGFYHNLVRTFRSHWSYGYQSSFSNSTFNNIKRRLFIGPAIEYNIFKYKDVNSRFFVIRYGVDATNNTYYETTIFDKQKETVYGQRFSAALTLNKKWGTFNTGVYYRNYFHDTKLNTKGINARANIKLTGSLSFFVYADGNIIHNQLNLVKGNASEQEVLTRKRQLASGFNYNSSFGLTYRFGSILNNFVNSSFDGYGGF